MLGVPGDDVDDVDVVAPQQVAIVRGDDPRPELAGRLAHPVQILVAHSVKLTPVISHPAR
jgi:hypothetical protein